ncbi:NAD(P)H-binding protein [Synechococcales cyanobacterium C]|uniref:NAD(P)H-binding protein n=1 Tax=Petrachloros mirabilis ULC683 TaxID=2781853 RepID=A0A8K1ZVR9_9CYAN|nr:SDR family oxidoreductase [Petrachloros mirabilis]NCJ06029.1 NAD(P)H-binding protein [Petrachloros mirabilis ULC683]
MKVLVAGATGQTGRRIVQQLVARQISVRALVRDLNRAQTLFPPKVERAVGDVMNPGSLQAALADCTVLICATGAAPSLNPLGPLQVDYLGTKNLVDTAKAQGIQHFVLVSSLCVSQLFHPLNLFWLILVWKRQAEAYLEASGLTYTIVRPGGLKNDDSPDAIVMAGADTLFEGSIPRSKVAQVCIEALFEPKARQKIVEIVAKPEAPERPLAECFAQA